MFVFLKLNSNMDRHQVNVENSSPKALDPAPRGSLCAHVWTCVRVCSVWTRVDVRVFSVHMHRCV